MNIELIYLSSAIITIFAIAFAFQKHKELKLRFYTNLIVKSFLKKQERFAGEKYFSTIGLINLIQFLYSDNNKEAKKALNSLLCGESNLALEYLKNKHTERRKYLSICLKSFDDKTNTIKEFERLKPENHILIELVSLYFHKNEISKAKFLVETLLNNKNKKKLSKEIKATALYYLAQINLKDGDLYSATENNNKAISLFEKTNLNYEAAKAMLLMGLIYRFAFIEDIAEIFFKSALDSFRNIDAIDGIADTYANLAMLNLNRELYETAIEQHEIAIRENEKIGRRKAIANSLNHLGLIEIVRNNFSKASTLLNKALNIHKEEKNKIGIAISYELLAQINFKNNDIKQAKKHILFAISNNKEAKNIPATNDCLYLLAQILMKEENYNEAIKLLREIIKVCENNENIFPIANAYSLLGVIYLKQNELGRAKALLQKSLYREMKDDRIEAIACDYTNIGIIEAKRGNIEEAKSNWKLALKLAESSEDKDLIKFLNEKLTEE